MMKPALFSLLILASASAAEEPSKGVLTNLVEGIASALDLEYAQPGSRAGGLPVLLPAACGRREEEEVAIDVCAIARV